MGDVDNLGLSQTPLEGLHRELGARMVPFAGYSMPVSYPLGVMKEHQHTRAAAGLFDVSHMGQVRLTARSGNVNDAALALERLVPVSVSGLAEGRQQYGFFTNDAGGIIDDLMIARRADHLYLVINASRKAVDLAHLADHLGADCIVEEVSDRALIALQGPAAASSLAQVAPRAADMAFMDVCDFDTGFGRLTVSRSGYTGEDGYEISVPSANASALAQALLAMDAVEAIGLGARDSLRLEAGLCLYGNDIDASTTPVEAAIEWAVQKVRRADGAREGGFPGAAVILPQLGTGAARRRVGIRPEGRAPMRDGTLIFASETASDPVGKVTSGAFGPSVGGPVAMAYVASDAAASGTRVYGEVRGKRLAADVATLPFHPHSYKR